MSGDYLDPEATTQHHIKRAAGGHQAGGIVFCIC